MKDGLLLVNRSYYNEFNKNKTRNPQIIDAISKMAEMVLHNSVKFIKMEKHIVGIFSSEYYKDGNENLSKLESKDKKEKKNKNIQKIKNKNGNKRTLSNKAKNSSSTDSSFFTNSSENSSVLESQLLINDIKSAENMNLIQKINISAYCIGDEKLIEDQIFTLLKKITRVFVKNYGPFKKSNLEDTSKYQDFLLEIDKILKDIQYYPLDRLRLAIL